MKECRQHNSGIGGQAVLEGVMMRNKEKYAIAVRKSDGSKAYVVSYRSYWRHDVPPNYEDELVEYFHIETKCQKMSVDCFFFLSEYELLDT